MLRRGETEPFTDLTLNGLRIATGVDEHDVLPTPEQFQHRIALRVVVAQARGESLGGVVLPGGQFAAADVAAARSLRAVLDEVVVHAATGAQPPGEHPAPHLG